MHVPVTWIFAGIGIFAVLLLAVASVVLLACGNAHRKRLLVALEEQNRLLRAFAERQEAAATATTVTGSQENGTGAESVTITGYRKPRFIPEQPKTAKPPPPEETAPRKVKRW